MPTRARPPKATGDGPLLKTWRQEGVSGTRAKVWLSLRRLAAIAIAVALIGWLGYLMLSPLLLPKSYFAYWCTDEVQPLVVPPMEYTAEDFAGFTVLENALTPASLGGKALSYSRLMSPKVLQAELDALKSSSIQGDHPVIIFVAAHGIVREGKAYLVCGNFTAEQSNSLDGLYPASKLVKQMAEIPGGPKLLLLDATRNDYAPRLGMIENTFAEAIREEISALKIPSVWVLNSSSPGERSYVSPALRRSIFGYMCAAGLQGAADKDEDREVDLDELTSFVQFNVARWVKQSTGDTATQTPMLLSTGGEGERRGGHLLYTANLPEVESVSAVMSSAESPDSRTDIVAAVQDFLSDEVDEFGLSPIFTAIGTAKTKLGLDAEEEESENQAIPEADEPSQRESQNQVELGLFGDAWRLTQAIPSGASHPASYAPQLWRLHLDRLLWLGYQQQSGERMNQLPLIDELRGLIQSLNNFGKEADLVVGTNPNVVDRMRQAVITAPALVSEAPTIGLAEAIASADSSQAMPEKLAAFVKDFDSWLRSPGGMDRLDAIKEANWNTDWGRYYELQFLDSYRNDPEVPLDTAKTAFRVRRLGEQVAADLAFGQGWASEIVGEADRLRLEAERLLVDHADGEWLHKATGNLQRAGSLYADAQTKLAGVHLAMQRQNELLIRARDYLRWSRYCWGDAASRAPSAQRIEGLLGSLKDLRNALNSASPTNVPNLSELQRIHADIERQLDQGVDELASAPYEPGDSQRISALLKTALLDADQRAKCIEAHIEADAELMRSFETALPASPSATVPTNTAREALALDHAKVERTMLETFSPDVMPQTVQWPDMTQKGIATVVAAGKAVGDWLSELDGILNDEVDANSNLSDSNRRRQRFSELRQAELGLYLVDAIDANALSSDATSVVAKVSNAMWYDLLRSNRERFVRAQADASVEEAETLRVLANQCGAVASKISSQPELMNVDAPQIGLQGSAGEVELVAVDETTVDFTLQSFGYDGPVWVVAQYDPGAIAVSGVNWTILSQQQIEDTAVDEDSTREPGYPYWPQARQNISETMALTTGQSRDFAVTVRRLRNARGNTTLVLKAISNENCIREQIPVRLPGRQNLEISVASANSVNRNPESGLRLFANRTQELTIYVANTGDQQRSVVASIYAPEGPVSFPIPTGSLESTASEEILRRIGNRSAIAVASVPLKLSPGTSPQPLQFDFQTSENKTLLGASPKEGPIKLEVPHGLLLDIVDQETREHTIRWLQFEVWRPHAFLNARANYDPGSRRLLVTVEAIDPKLFPAGEVELALDVEKRLVSAREGGTSSTILEPGRSSKLEATLTGRWPQDFNPLADEFLPIRINVDNYPRGFEFKLPKTTTVTNLLPTRERASLRFGAPLPDTAYKAAKSIKALVQLDVPEGYFNSSDNFAEVGIDANEDRELRDEEAIVLRSDRQLKLFAKLPTEGGTLALEPEVGDFELTLRTAGINDRKVNILGQLTRTGRVSERTYTPIVLDGEGPELGVVKLVRRGPLVVVELNPQDLTGVATVEAAFESPTEVKWQAGKRGDGGQWFVELNTEGLSPGEHTVLLRASDSVGNTCEVVSTPWTNAPAAEVAPDVPDAIPSPNGVAAAVKNHVSGRVVYGSKEVTNVEVTLTGAGAPAQPARTSGGGAFDFGMVPPGTYTLKARGLAGGNFHRAEMQVTVSDQPKTPVELVVKVR